MRSLGFVLLSSTLGAGTGLAAGGLVGLVGGAVTGTAFVVWLALVGSLGGGLIGLIGGGVGAAVLALVNHVDAPIIVGRVAVALSAATAGSAAAALTFGSLLADSALTLGGIFAATAFLAGLGVPAVERATQDPARRVSPKSISTT